jgi:hypothetical protein
VTILDLSGKRIDKVPDAPTLLNSLKALVSRIESGELKVESFYLIAECETGQTHSFDNSLTAGEAIVMLEREKFHILCALAGIKV